MRTVRLGRTEVEVPAIGVGTWAHGGPNSVREQPVGWYGATESESRSTLLSARGHGMTHIDTADVYGDGRSERIIGSLWDDVPRDDFFLASKVGWDPGNHSHYYHPAQIRRQLEQSLRNLRTEFLDLYYLHHCDFGPEDEYRDDALDLMHTFRNEGKIRFLGLSDWKTEAIVRHADAIQPDVIQCYRNVVDDTYESSGLRQWVETHDVGVVFFSPLKHALLLGLFEGPVTFGNGDHRSAQREFRDYGLIARLRACRWEMEKRFGDHAQPVLHGLIGALLADSPTGVALIGQRRPEHAEAAATIGEVLSDEDAQWVRRLYQENGRLGRAAWQQGGTPPV